jgi:NADPH-dependent glutamate synthase beta subunit-like oxidoreductase
MTRTTLIFHEVNCSGCHACEVACKQEHGLGVGPRLVRVIERSPFFLPLYCHHCEDAPCVIACWEDAIRIDPGGGIVLHQLDACNGCLAVAGVSGQEKQDNSPCMVGCGAHNNVQGFVGLASKGWFDRAIRVIKETSPFPSVCGRVCPHPCEDACNRDPIDASVSIRSIERFVADWDRQRADRYRPKVKPARGEKVAVIGSGPAGLSAAYFLAREGYPVTVFEKLPVAGGMMAVGIPEFRLPKAILSTEIGFIQELGVEIRTGVTFGTDISLESLRADGYRAVFLATGLHRSARLNLPDEDTDGVLRGIDFLRDVSMGRPVSVGKKVIVVGGGNVALDVAMTALRTGAEAAAVVCLESRQEMPAWEREIRSATEEGIQIVNRLGPQRFLRQNGRLSGIEFKRCTRVFDAGGRFDPQYDEAELTTLEAETVIVAIGQVLDLPNIEAQGIPLRPDGTLQADPLTLATPIEGVFAGGDAQHGPASVAQAIGSGRQAAISIDRYLRGRDLRLGRLGRDKFWRTINSPQQELYDPAPRAVMPRLQVGDRVHHFQEVELGLTEELVVREGKRCLMCGASCVQACPYDVMQFNQDVLKAVKCDLCLDRRGQGLSPACTVVCPTRCIDWGDPEAVPRKVEALV